MGVCVGGGSRPRHSPHPPIGFAVGRVYADGPLAVLHSACIIPQFAVGCGSGEAKAGGQSPVLTGRLGQGIWGRDLASQPVRQGGSGVLRGCVTLFAECRL